jgi:hypothetical protein
MSKQNKANKSNYIQAGRLSPDEMAREQKKQSVISAGAKGGERVSASAPEPRPKKGSDVRGRGERTGGRGRAGRDE